MLNMDLDMGTDPLVLLARALAPTRELYPDGK